MPPTTTGTARPFNVLTAFPQRASNLVLSSEPLDPIFVRSRSANASNNDGHGTAMITPRAGARR